MSLTLECPATPATSYQEVYDWLTREAEERGIQATLITHKANMSEGRLYLLVHISNAVDLYDEVAKLEELERSWNSRKPEPNPRIFLIPAEESDKPQWAASYAPVQQAIDRYYEAFDAFRAATSSDEAQKALKEMETAKQSELKASQQLNLVV